MIRDQIIFDRKLNFLQTKCFVCSLKDHMETDCPLIHYVADRIKIVRKYIKDPGQRSRFFYNRAVNKYSKFNSLHKLNEVQRCGERFKSFYEYVDESVEQNLDQDSFEESPETLMNLSNYSDKKEEPEKKINKKLTFGTNLEKYENHESLPNVSNIFESAILENKDLNENSHDEFNSKNNIHCHIETLLNSQTLSNLDVELKKNAIVFNNDTDEPQKNVIVCNNKKRTKLIKKTVSLYNNSERNNDKKGSLSDLNLFIPLNKKKIISESKRKKKINNNSK